VKSELVPFKTNDKSMEICIVSTNAETILTHRRKL